MKTLEFKLTLNLSEQAAIDRWLGVQRKVWNQGLELLKEFESFSYYNKADELYAACCPINWEYSYRPNPEGTGYIGVPLSRVGFKPKYGDYQQFCPLPQVYREPRILGSLTNPKTGKVRSWQSAFASLFSHELNPWLVDSGVPAKVTQATIKRLTTSWEQYKKGKRKAPRFKRYDEFNTISDCQAGNAVAIGGDRLRLPKMGIVTVKGLDKRWGKLEIKTYHIKREPSGYYLYLVGDVPERLPKLSDKAVGIDPGVKAAITLDDGRQYAPANPLKRYLKRLKRLQRKLSRQIKHSNGWKRTKQLIARLHEKIRRTRKAFNHKISTKIVREFGAIAFEGSRLQNMVRRPKPKLREDGKGWESNRAAQKAGLNRALLDVAIGQCRSMVEDKAKAWGREFTKPEARNTSITCNGCGVVDKASRISQSLFRCTSCGNEDNADANASKNILVRGLSVFSGSYRSLMRKVKRVESLSGTMKPEEVKTSSLPEYGRQSLPPGNISLKVQLREPGAEILEPPKPPPGKRRRRSTRAPDTEQLPLDLWGNGQAETG